MKSYISQILPHWQAVNSIPISHICKVGTRHTAYWSPHESYHQVNKVCIYYVVLQVPLIKSDEVLVVAIQCPEVGEVLLRLVKFGVGCERNVQQLLHSIQQVMLLL